MQTKKFRMGAGKFAMEMIYRYAAPWLLALSALGITGIVLGITVNYKWLLAALLIIFVLMPMILILLYYYFGLRREAYVNTLPHTIELQKEGLLFRLYLRRVHEAEDEKNETGEKDEVISNEYKGNKVKGNKDKGNMDKGNEDKGNKDKGNEDKGSGNNGNEEEYDVREEFFPFDAMLSVRIGLNSMSIPLKSPAKGFLWIPSSAFDDPQRQQDFMLPLISKLNDASKINDISKINDVSVTNDKMTYDKMS